ncbi:MAG: DUF4190 domain-containing protein [Actinobacteria bacterium]|nr:DUF4190 domain-containing protein [Actinomycetota bacterium]MSY26199.1 DUF4190 domain-containing protein [Actinomycetota bacterium]
MAVDMSDVSQGPGWWMAADGKWYPPAPPAPPAPPTFQAPGAPPAYYPQATGPKNDGMSIAGLVCGISGLATLVLCGIGLIPAILGVVFGLIGMKKIDASGGALKGRGMALAGAICGGVAIGLFVLYIVIVIINAIANSN